MPTTRRASSGNRNTTNRQSTLSFNHRVTKSVPKSGKDLIPKPAKESPLGKHVSSAQPEPKEEEKEEDAIRDEDKEPLTKQPQTQPKKSESELRAAKITDRQIDQYWRQLERERIAKRVHQKGLTLAEKVLRYWDVSSQYGPYVGITRMKRWQRADRLGLNPPLEVLAVLQKEEAKGTPGVEKAHMDEILNSTTIGAV
ncbi:DNA polymerase delta, subunit 4-domain-containing protein [Daldinia sp. FL1419]|nr:DNA polymerase delta, subunit 4-domain-containing protein [Daldinia sp. FL1419]